VRVFWTLGAQEDARSLVPERSARSAASAGRSTRALALAAERARSFPRPGEPAGARYRHPPIMGGACRLVYREEEDAIGLLGVIWGSSQWPIARS
jgi:hypothetical protein